MRCLNCGCTTTHAAKSTCWRLRQLCGYCDARRRIPKVLVVDGTLNYSYAC